jgi:putative membrane protein
MAWFFGILVCTRLDTAGHDTALGITVGILIMALFIVAERLGHFIEEPMSNTAFDLPMYRFCAGITADLLGPGHPLAHPPDRDDAVIWM